jgi:mannosyltransferase
MSTPSTACTTCSCTAGFKFSRPPSSGPACQAAWRSEARRPGVVVLGRQFSSRTVAVSAGVVCAILPRSTWAGIEARPYALSMLAAVWLTVLFVHATRRDNAWLWLSYGIVVATSILLDIYLALMLLAHFAFLCVYRPSRTVLARFAITSVLAGCAVTAFVVKAMGQAHQIIWIAPIGRRTIEDVAVQQYFERSPCRSRLCRDWS